MQQNYYIKPQKNCSQKKKSIYEEFQN